MELLGLCLVSWSMCDLKGACWSLRKLWLISRRMSLLGLMKSVGL